MLSSGLTDHGIINPRLPERPRAGHAQAAPIKGVEGFNANSHKQSNPLFDPTINYGHVLTALSIVIAGTGAYYGMSVELHNVDQRVAKIEATLQQLANVVVMTARQDERLIAI